MNLKALFLGLLCALGVSTTYNNSITDTVVSYMTSKEMIVPAINLTTGFIGGLAGWLYPTATLGTVANGYNYLQNEDMNEAAFSIGALSVGYLAGNLLKANAHKAVKAIKANLGRATLLAGLTAATLYGAYTYLNN